MKSTERDARSSPVPAMRPPGSPRTGVPGRLHREAAGERPPRARPQRRGSPGPIPNPAVKPAFAESTAALGCGRAGRRARGGRFSTCAERGLQGDAAPCGPLLRHGLPAPVSGIFGGCAFPFGRHRGSVASSAGAFLRCGVPCWAGLFMDCAGGRLSFVMRRFPIRIFVGHRKRLCGL